MMLVPVRKYIEIITYLMVYTMQGVEGQNKLIARSSNVCVCPGDVVTYKCTVFGGAEVTTVWKGDFFHCSTGKRLIELVHRQREDFSSQICNDGNVVGRIIRVENNSFISQLNITLTRDIAGKSVECISDNGTDTQRVGSLNLTSGLIPSPPESISWATTLSQFYAIRVFNWNAHSSNCSAVHYNILSSNCGSCPTTTNHTSVTCTGVPTGGNMCTFSVQTVVCGNLTGELSQVLLYNSDAPGGTEYRTALISAVSLGVALLICLIGSITVIVLLTILLIRSKSKVGTVVVNSTVSLDQVASRTTSESVSQSSRISTKKNISYVVHSPKTDPDV